jgi:hypothetical protein
MLCSIAHATNFIWNSVITQGLFHTDGNNIYGNSEDDVSFDYSELSLNANYRLSSDFKLSSQGIYRHAGAGFDGLNLDYLFLEKGLLQNQVGNVGFRLVRIKQLYGIYNKTRDVAFTRPGIYVPQSLYLDVNGWDSALSLDGAGIFAHYYFEEAILSVELL